MPSSQKRKYPAADALAVARELCAALKPVTNALIVAGSLRRRREFVGDVEILYIPLMSKKQDPAELLPLEIQADEAELVIWTLLCSRVLWKREHNGGTSWGLKNKLAVHGASGIPVDLFAARPANWWCQVVCRTGSAESNIRICQAAQRRGWKWQPYGVGFTDRRGELIYHLVQSERDVFEAVGLKYLEPWERNADML